MNSLCVPRLVRIASMQWKFLTRSSTNSSGNKDGGGSGKEELPYWRKQNPDEPVKDFSEIPGPRFLPIIGHEWRYKPYIGQYNRDYIHHTFAKLFKQYGYIVREHIGRDRVIVHLFHPEDIIQVYDNDGVYPSRISNRIMERYRRERPDQYSCAGLGPSNGEEWYLFRRQFAKVPYSFLKDGRAKDLDTLADDLVEKIAKSLDKFGEVDVMPDFYRWTLEGVGFLTVNKRLGCLDDSNPVADKLIEAAHTTNDCIYLTETSPHQWEKQYKRLVPAQDYFTEVVGPYIEQALQEENTLLRSIVTPEVSLKDAQTFVLDLFQAGIHTTAVSAAFALYHLARNRSIQDELRKEIMESLPTKDDPDALDILKDTPLLFGVIRETLRINPPTIGNGRILAVPLTLGGYHLPEGAMVILHHMTASRLEENFPEPHLFKPERYLPSTKYSREQKRKRGIVSRPFGSGYRACIGRTLALAQMNVAVVKFIKNYEISYHHEDVDTVNRLHNEPDRPMRLRFKPLSN